MLINNLYDFDKTILEKDSFLMFYFYLLKRKPILFWHFFVMVFKAILCILGIVSIEKFKETILHIYNYFDNREKILSDFALKAKQKTNAYYLKQMRDDDVVCSASPTFIVKAIMDTINPNAIVIGSEISKDTLKYVDGEKNCKGANKIVALKKYFKTDIIECENAYSDSLSDIYLFDIAKRAYMIVSGKPVLYK